MLAVELQQKYLATRAVHRAIAHLIPFVPSEPSDGHAKLSPDESEGVFDVVAVLVELGSLELMLRGPEQQPQALRMAKRVAEEYLLGIAERSHHRRLSLAYFKDQGWSCDD